MSEQRLSAMELSEEQRQVVKSFGAGMAVLAGAGSGKTTTLVRKCLELLRRNPEARLIAVSFTERSASDLREKLSRALFEEGGRAFALEHHRVTTIHGLCASILREYPRLAGLEGEERMLSAPEAEWLWEAASEFLWSDDLPEALEQAWQRLVARESKSALGSLLRRVRELEPFGVLSSLSQSEDPAAQALAVLGEALLERYDRLKRKRGVLDFGDLERAAGRILSTSEVRAEYQRRFDFVLVDEFQDTNPVQAKILWSLARQGQTNLCVVGDPKQSIYRFRDADVSVFEECCASLQRHFTLSKNFRSRPGVLQFVNQVCEKSFSARGMHYDPLVAVRPSPEGGGSSVEKIRLAGEADFAEWVWRESESGTRLQEVVLLLRRIRGSEKWLRALSERGIPVAVGSGGLFWEEPRVRECVSFLKWWDQPGNALSGAVFLRAPWVGIPDERLDEWVRKDPSFRAPFFESDHPLALVLKPLRGVPHRPGELLLRLLEQEDIERELGMHLLQLWHRAEELSSQGLSFHEVVREFVRAMEEKRREPEVPPPAGRNRLLVLTIHGAKGLEFPHVLLLDFPPSPLRSSPSPLLFWDRRRGAFLGGRDEDGSRTPDGAFESSFRELEKKKNLDESLRLFYVALTRARERLVLFYAGDSAPAEEKLAREEKKVFNSDDWRGWVGEGSADAVPVREMGFSGVKDPPKGPVVQETLLSCSNPAATPPSPALIRPRHSVTEWNLLSRCARAYEWSFIRPVLVAEGITEAPIFTGAKVETLSEREIDARELGSRIHSCLERGDFEGLKQIESEVGRDRFTAEPVLSFAFSSPWMAPSKVDGSRKVWSELAFEVPMGALGAIVVGAIDRLVWERDTGYQLIDFKVSSEASRPSDLLEAYGTQMRLYAEALKILAPESAGQTQAHLIQIFPGGVQKVRVPLQGFSPEPLSTLAQQIVSGASGAPSPGLLCRFCEFRRRCGPVGDGALDYLQEMKILREITGKQRDRLFSYQKYLQILNDRTEIEP